MIERWFEPFALLEKAAVPDGLGGESLGFSPALTFQGVLSFTSDPQDTMAGQSVPAESLVLLHEFDVTLTPGDHVRRERDGAVYRVTTRSDSMRAPAFSGLRFAQVGVERLVIPC